MRCVVSSKIDLSYIVSVMLFDAISQYISPPFFLPSAWTKFLESGEFLNCFRVLVFIRQTDVCSRLASLRTPLRTNVDDRMQCSNQRLKALASQTINQLRK